MTAMMMMFPMSPPTMQRMYTPRLSLNSGTVDHGSAMDWGVSGPTEIKKYFADFTTAIWSL